MCYRECSGNCLSLFQNPLRWWTSWNLEITFTFIYFHRYLPESGMFWAACIRSILPLHCSKISLLSTWARPGQHTAYTARLAKGQVFYHPLLSSQPFLVFRNHLKLKISFQICAPKITSVEAGVTGAEYGRQAGNWWLLRNNPQIKLPHSSFPPQSLLLPFGAWHTLSETTDNACQIHQNTSFRIKSARQYIYKNLQ